VVAFNNRIIERIVAADNRALNETLAKASEEGSVDPAEAAALRDTLADAYRGHAQLPRRKAEHPGYVSVETFAERPPVVERICALIDKGFRPCDIMILVRGATDGAKVAAELLDFKRRNEDPRYRFDVMTQEALIVGNAPVSSFIAAALRLALNPDDSLSRAVYNHYLGRPFDRPLDDSERDFFRSVRLLSPEEAFERIVMRHALQGDRRQTAYLQAIHEQIISFCATKIADIALFLRWWEETGKNRSLSVEESATTVEITTIHKAKGLEKRAVLIPYCSWSPDPKSSGTVQNIVWAEAQGDAAQRVAQERRTRTLLSGRADLFIVENAADSDISALLRRKEALKAAAGALEIVELGRKDVLLVLAKQRPLAAAVEEQVAAEDVIFRDARGLGDDGQDAAALFAAEQRQRVDIREVLHAVVRCAVHVDGDIGNDEQVAVDAHEFFNDLAVCAHEDAARDGEWAVEPRGHQHAAVFFGGELDIMRAAAVGMLFQAERRRVGVRRSHGEAAVDHLRHAEGDDARAVAADEILPAGGYLPAFAFGKLGIAVCEELLADVLGHMVAGGAIFDKMQQFSCRCMLHGDVLHSLFLFGGIIAHVMLLGKRTLPLRRTKRGRHLCICPYLVEL